MEDFFELDMIKDLSTVHYFILTLLYLISYHLSNYYEPFIFKIFFILTEALIFTLILNDLFLTILVLLMFESKLDLFTQ